MRFRATSGCAGEMVHCAEGYVVDCRQPFGSAPFFQAWECESRGAVCVEVPEGPVRCVEATCAPDTPARCVDDSTLEQCHLGHLVRHVCPRGTRCDAIETCLGAGPTCGAARCEGDVLVECDWRNNHSSTSTDCSVLGQVCVTDCGSDGREHEYDCLVHGYVGCADAICTPRSPAL